VASAPRPLPVGGASRASPPAILPAVGHAFPAMDGASQRAPHPAPPAGAVGRGLDGGLQRPERGQEGPDAGPRLGRVVVDVGDLSRGLDVLAVAERRGQRLVGDAPKLLVDPVAPIPVLILDEVLHLGIVGGPEQGAPVDPGAISPGHRPLRRRRAASRSRDQPESTGVGRAARRGRR